MGGGGPRSVGVALWGFLPKDVVGAEFHVNLRGD